MRTNVVVGAILGVVADLDFLPGLLLGDPSRFHHAMTHSILMIVIAAAIAAAIARLDRLRWMLIASLAYGSHLALDMITHAALWDSVVLARLERVFCKSGLALPTRDSQ